MHTALSRENETKIVKITHSELGRLVSQQIPALKTTDDERMSNLFRDATSERNLGLFSSMLEAHEGGTSIGE